MATDMGICSGSSSSLSMSSVLPPAPHEVRRCGDVCVRRDHKSQTMLTEYPDRKPHPTAHRPMPSLAPRRRSRSHGAVTNSIDATTPRCASHEAERRQKGQSPVARCASQDAERRQKENMSCMSLGSKIAVTMHITMPSSCFTSVFICSICGRHAAPRCVATR